MKQEAKSIRPFIGAKNFEESRSFYRAIGFEEKWLDPGLMLFTWGSQGFYLQNAFVEDWVNNTMIFMEIDSLDEFWEELQAANLPADFPAIRVSAIVSRNWGREFFVHDPSGILWHFGTFNK